LDTNKWIEIDSNYREEIKLKQKLLNSPCRNDIFLHKEEAYAGSMEALKMLIEHLPYQYPNMFHGNHSKTKITNLITDQTFDLTESNHLHPLEIASLLVQEDLVIMQQHPNQEIYHANVISYYLNFIRTFFSGISGLFSIWMVTKIKIWFTISISSYSTCSIFSRKITYVNG
jgi:hypothetical protein